MEESLPDRLINPCHYVDGSLSLAISTERFSSQAYLNAINDENTTTLQQIVSGYFWAIFIKYNATVDMEYPT